MFQVKFLIRNEIDCGKTEKLELLIRSNLAQCYLNMEHYEDAIEQTDRALLIDPSHKIVLMWKAKALRGIYKFEESIELFAKLGMKDEINIINRLCS